jgi:hypothetical protein
MHKWLCYDDDTVFYIQAATREEAQAFAELHDGHVVCAMQPLDENNIDHADKRPQ